ncbi:hypothetical protein [Actinomadura xylanilytica]|nr:hypothetical protein [Actinomadura xylanilytica]
MSMSGAGTATLSDEEIVDLGRWMSGAVTDGWRDPAMAELLKEREWKLSHPGDQAVVPTGSATGDARLLPVGDIESRYVSMGEEYVGLAVPVAVTDRSAKAQTECFRRVARMLTQALGPAPIVGSHGDLRPFFESGPAWGDPYLRWRGGVDSLELRAGVHGPELVLMPNGPVENWLSRQGHGEQFALKGFLGERHVVRFDENGARRVYDQALAGLELPGLWQAEDWDTFSIALTEWLTTFSAELRALGVWFGPVIHGGDRVGFDVYPLDDGVVLAADLPEDFDAAPLGWSSESIPDDPWIGAPHQWRLSGVNAKDLATALVETARATGLTAPNELVIADGTDHQDGDGRDALRYSFTCYGLGLRQGW